MDINDLIQQVIGASFKVHNTLGSGFLESVYEKSLLIELRQLRLKAESQVPIPVYYQGESVGYFKADILVNDSLFLELKAVSRIEKIHEVQLVNYLTATKVDDGLIINFSESRVEVKRKYRIRNS